MNFLFLFKVFVRKKIPFFYKFLHKIWWQHIFKSIWLLIFKPKGVLVYVGLNKGYSFGNIFYKYELAIGYEANPELFNNLKIKFRKYKNVKIFNFAASDKNSEENFYISDNLDMVSSSLSKFSKDNSEKIGYKKIIKVNTVNLGEHLESMKINLIDEYVSDAQGYDLKILKTLENYIDKNKVKKITCEVTRNFKENMYYEANNYEKSFDNFFPKQYKKVASGEGSSLKNGDFQKVPDSYDTYDVMWLNQIYYKIK